MSTGDKLNIQFRIKAVDNFSRNMDKLDRKLKSARRAADGLEFGKLEVDIDGDATGFHRTASRVERRKKQIEDNSIIVDIKASGREFRRSMDRIADFSRDTGEFIRHELTAGLVTIGPVLTSTVTGALGSILPMVGVLGGSIMGLGTAFGLAGTGAVAFGSVAVSNLGKVFEVSKDLKDLDEKLAETSDLEKRAEIIEEMETVYNSLSDAQKNAYKSMNKLSSTWKKLSKSLEDDTVEIFAGSMDFLNTVLSNLEPMFRESTKAVGNLVDQLNREVKTESFEKFFDFLNKNAGPALEMLGKVGINTMIGFMNLMRAFGPLAMDMAVGLENMTGRFRDWSASLDESKKFQAFIDYIRENGPKMLNIIGNIIGGLVGIGEAFAPVASDMLTGLENITQKFEDWGQSLKDSKEFKEFVQFVKENTPKVLDLLDNLVELIYNIGDAMAPVSSEMLDFVNSLLEFSNWAMDNIPYLDKIVGLIFGLGSAFLFVYPLVKLTTIVLGPLYRVLKLLGDTILRKVIPNLGKMGGKMDKTKPKAGGLGSKIKDKLIPRLKGIGKSIFSRVLPALARFGGALLGLSGPMGWVAAGTITLGAIVISKWDEISAFVSEKAELIKENVSDGWENMKKNVSTAGDKIKKNVEDGWENMWDNISGSMGKIKKNVEDGFQNIRDNVSGKTEDSKEKADKNFQNLAKAMKFAMDDGKGWVNDMLGDIKSDIEGTDLYQSGRKIIGSAVSGIESMKKKVSGAVENVAGIIRSYWPFSPAKEGPLRDLHKIDFAWAVTKSINDSEGAIHSALTRMLSVPAVQPESNRVSIAQARSSYERERMSDRNGGVNNEPLRSNTNENNETQRQPVIIRLQLGNNEFEAHVDDITKVQERNKKRLNRFRGART
ncbi:hypothetical protein GCM10008934_16430 [Virgibacillus salarius]|uniref:hypothetical protein n=1 Tax=Virgibacillus salarius TaxID=447199 RepID=UPI0031D57059